MIKLYARLADDRAKWNAFVAGSGGCFLQSWEWMLFQRSLGRKAHCVELAAEPGGPLAAAALVVELPLPFPGKTYAYVPRGPVFAPGIADVEGAFRSVIGACGGDLLSLKTVFTRVDLPELPSHAGDFCESEIPALGFVPAKPMQPSDTLLLDLAQSEEALLAAMHQKTRYNIRLAERHGVRVREAALDPALMGHDMELFWHLLHKTSKRDGFSTHTRGYYEEMMRQFGSSGSAGAVMDPAAHVPAFTLRLVIAEHEGKPAAAGIFGVFGGTMTYLHGALSEALRGVMAPYALHWHMVRAAKAAGLTEYDFWGIAPEGAARHPLAGVSRFKLGFGGRRVSYPGGWELPNERAWYTLYRALKRAAALRERLRAFRSGLRRMVK